MKEARLGRCIASPPRYTGRKGARQINAMQNKYLKEVDYESGTDYHDREMERAGKEDCKAEGES